MKTDLPDDHPNPTGLPRLPHSPSYLFYVLTRALRTRVKFYPQHWLQCHMDEYQFEFEFGWFELTQIQRAQGEGALDGGLK